MKTSFACMNERYKKKEKELKIRKRKKKQETSRTIPFGNKVRFEVKSQLETFPLYWFDVALKCHPIVRTISIPTPWCSFQSVSLCSSVFHCNACVLVLCSSIVLLLECDLFQTIELKLPIVAIYFQ